MRSHEQTSREYDAMIIPVFIQMLEDPVEHEWMETLYIQHRKLMMSASHYYLSNSQYVEDVVNDSIIRLYEKIDLLRTLDSNALKAYIVTVVRNTAFNYLRKQKSISQHFLYLSDYSAETICADDNVEQTVESRDQLALVRILINGLPEKEQCAIRLKIEGGLEYEEIAEIMNTSPSNVRQLISRARKHIQEALCREEVRA